MKKLTTGLLFCLALGNAHGDVVAPSEDFLKAPDRIQWHAGGLYDGIFQDGTRFQIQLAYPRPSALSGQDAPFTQSYWYPKHLKDTVFNLQPATEAGREMRLVLRAASNAPVEESFDIALGPDLQSGSGTWTSARLKKQMTFSLQRAVAYDYVVVQRPAPLEAVQDDANRRFKFASWFPLLDDVQADAWVREQAGQCAGDLDCYNGVQVRWKSPSLMSLEATAWEYNYRAAHGNGGSTTRQYGVEGGRLSPLGLDAFVDMSATCVAGITAGIVGELHAKQLPWADEWAKDAPLTKAWLKFTPTASGIAFHFDPYEVGPYSEGAPSVFLTRAQLGQCLRSLPVTE